MKFSLHWLQDYVELTVDRDALFQRLTMTGTEVEHVTTQGIESPRVVVAEILEAKPHPNAERLKVCRVTDGKEERQIVCGAPNCAAGMKVPLALPGAELPGGLKIKETKLRGELSQGMLCGPSEIGLGEDDGSRNLMALDPQTPVGKKLHEIYRGDTLFDVEITPNRPDLLSYHGIAREIAAIGCGKLKPQPQPKIEWPKNRSEWSLKLINTEGVPYHTATVMGNLKVTTSPEWLQEKITATGHRPINNVVDITNYMAWETGQPMHAFDGAKLSGKVISIRNAKAGETITTLDNKTYTLASEDLVIADDKGPIDVAGVMGGKNTSVDMETREIFMVAGWFSPAHIRRTSRRLGLSSDASYRFERRVDAGALLAARDRAVRLIQELCGAKILAAPIIEGIPPVITRRIKLRTKRAEAIIGLPIAEAKIKSGLEALGLKSIETQPDGAVWETPSFRYDLEREIDLIEEVARLHGMDAVPATINYGLHRESEADQAHDRVLQLRQTLAARGWDECVTDALVDPAQAGDLDTAVALSNPLNELYTHLRPGLKNSLLASAAKNLARNNRQLKLFEIGRVYQKAKKKIVEPLRLGLLVAGEAHEASWWEAERPVDLFDLKGATDFLECCRKVPASACLESGRVSAAELKAHGIKTPVFYAEFALDEWLKLPQAAALYQPLPQYPEVRRDVAVVVPRSMEHATIEKSIRSAKIKELEKVELFDVFLDDKGEKIPREKKSLAYALTYRASERTLREEEVNAWHEQLRERLKKELGCSFRET